VFCLICPGGRAPTRAGFIGGRQCQEADELGRSRRFDLKTCSYFQLNALRQDAPCGCQPPTTAPTSVPVPVPTPSPTTAVVIPTSVPIDEVRFACNIYRDGSHVTSAVTVEC
jgi:hypothetical protein